MNSLSPRLSRLAACVVVALAALVASAAVASADPASDYDTGLALGTEAYEYGVPLLDLDRIFKSSTSVTVCDHVTAHGPVNQFCSIRNLASADQHTVNAPNNDTPYSIAWLDLRKQPQVLHAPAIRNRFWEFELVDPWTNNFYNITSARRKMGPGDFNVTHGGDWAVVGPRFKGKLPHGVEAGKVALRPGLGRRPHLPPRREGSRAPAPDPGRVLDHTPVEVRHPLQAPAAQEGRDHGRPRRTSPARRPARTRSRSTRRSVRRCDGSPRRRPTSRCSSGSGPSASARR